VYRDTSSLRHSALKIKMIKLWFQFTLNLAVISPRFVYVGGIGDGVHMVNDTTTYIDHTFVNKDGLTGPKTLVDGIQGNTIIPELTFLRTTEEVSDVMVGGDGIIKFNGTKDAILERNLDVSPQGDIYQFRDDKYVQNKSAAQKRMNIIGMRNGLRPEDDVAFIWARKVL
jgi:hypothetical protein